MRRKPLYFIAFSLGTVLLNIALLNTPAAGFSVDTLTATPTVHLPSNVTLIGEIFPVVNTGPDAGVGLDPNNTQWPTVIKFLEPMEYHLVQENAESVKLVFTNNVSDADLWQIWAGRWVKVTGQYTPSKSFQVDSIQGIQPLTITDLNSGIMGQPKTIKSRQVTFIGQFHSTAPTDSVPKLSRLTYGVTYSVTDLMGKDKPVEIYLTPPIPTHITNTNGQEIDFPYIPYDAWAIFKGWVFDPPRYPKEAPNLIELQSIQLN